MNSAYVKEYRKSHVGHMTSMNDYSFTWESIPDKHGNTKQTIVFESYFAKIGKEEAQLCQNE